MYYLLEYSKLWSFRTAYFLFLLRLQDRGFACDDRQLAVHFTTMWCKSQVHMNVTCKGLENVEFNLNCFDRLLILWGLGLFVPFSADSISCSFYFLLIPFVAYSISCSFHFLLISLFFLIIFSTRSISCSSHNFLFLSFSAYSILLAYSIYCSFHFVVISFLTHYIFCSFHFVRWKAWHFKIGTLFFLWVYHQAPSICSEQNKIHFQLSSDKRTWVNFAFA